MDPGTGMVASAGIQAGSQLASGIANLALMGSQQHYQRKMMRYQRDIQKELMAEQNAYNLGMMDKEYNQNVALWNMNNAYNDPAAQRARLEAAGYNPYAMLGQGGAIGTSSSPAASAKGEPVGLPSVGVPNAPNMDMSFIGESVRAYQDSLYQSEMIREQTAKADLMKVDSAFRQIQNISDLYNKWAENKKLLADAKLSSEQRERIEFENKIYDATLPSMINLLNAAPEEKAKEMKILDANYQNLMDDLKTKELQRTAIGAGIQLTTAQISEIGANINFLNAKTRREAIQALGDIIGNGAAAMMFENLPDEIEFGKGWFHRYVQGTLSGAASAIIGAFSRKIGQ